MHRKITRTELGDREWDIALFDGVQPALKQLSSLLVPVPEVPWLSEIELDGERSAETRDGRPPLRRAPVDL